MALDSKEKDFLEKDFEREKTVFVSNVPPSVTHSQIFSYFSDYGSVKKVYVPKSKPNQPPRCFAFVTFDTVEQAEEVLTIGERGELHLGEALLYVEKNKKPTKATEEKREKEKESYRKRTAASALAPLRDPIFGDPLSVGFSVEYQNQRSLAKTVDLPPKALEKKEVSTERDREREREGRNSQKDKEGEREKQRPKREQQKKTNFSAAKRESNGSTHDNTNTANGSNNHNNSAPTTAIITQATNPLHSAIIQLRDEDVFMLLLQRHDPNARDDSGRTSLDLALNLEEQQKKKGGGSSAKLARIINTLLGYGAKTNLMQMSGDMKQKTNQNENQKNSNKGQPVNIKQVSTSHQNYNQNQNHNTKHYHNQNQTPDQNQRSGMEILELLKQVNITDQANQQNNAGFSPHSAAFFPHPQQQQQQQQQQPQPQQQPHKSSPKNQRNSPAHSHSHPLAPSPTHSFFPSSDLNASYGAPLPPQQQQPFAYPYAYVPAAYYYPPEVMATNYLIPQTVDQLQQFAQEPHTQLHHQPRQQFAYYFNQSYS